MNQNSVQHHGNLNLLVNKPSCKYLLVQWGQQQYFKFCLLKVEYGNGEKNQIDIMLSGDLFHDFKDHENT